jgi:hypothetical protein
MNKMTENGASVFKTICSERDPITYAMVIEDCNRTDLKGKRAVEFPLSFDPAVQTLGANGLTGETRIARWTAVAMGSDGELQEQAF